MKFITHTKLLLGIALLGTAFTSVMQPAQARPDRDKDDNRRGDWRDNRDNDRDKNRDRDKDRNRDKDRDNYRDRNGRDQHRANSRDQGPTRYRNNDPRYNNPRYGGYGNSPYGYGNNSNGNYGYGNNGYGNNGGNSYGNQSFTGRVTSVKSRDEFDIRIGNTTYNVYTDSRLTRPLRVGDTVRVYGQRVGKNDIRNASASLLSNRR